MKWAVRISGGLLLALALVVTAALVALTHLDLNSYRSQIERYLANELSMPVSLGHADFRLQDGLRLDFYDSRLGDENTKMQLDLPQLSLHLQTRPLIGGNLHFKRIEATAPQLRLEAASPGKKQKDKNEPTQPQLRTPWFEGLTIEALHIRRGTLNIMPTEGSPLRIEQIDTHFRGWSPKKAGLFSIDAQIDQDGSTAKLSAQGSLPRTRKNIDWCRALIDLKFAVHDLDLQTIDHQARKGDRIEIMRGQLFGIATDKVDGWMIGRLRRNGAATDVQIAGKWRATKAAHQMKDIQLKINQSSIQLNASLTRTKNPRLKGELTSVSLPAEDLMAVLPPRMTPMAMEGDLNAVEIHFNGPLPRNLTGAALLVKKATATIDLPLLTINEDLPLKEVRGRLDFSLRGLNLEGGHGELYGYPFEFSAHMQKPLSDNKRTFKAQLEGTFNLDKMATHLKNLPPKARIKGIVPVDAWIEGQGTTWQGQINAPLKAAAIDFGLLLQKQAQQTGQLRLTADSSGQLQLSSRLDKDTITVHGQLSRRDKGGFELGLHTSKIDLAALRAHSPLFAELRLRGTVEGRTRLRLGDKDWSLSPIELAMNKVGFHLWGAVADFDALTGVARTEGWRVTLPDMRVRWGRSRVDVSGFIPDIRNPVAHLKAQADTLWADSIVFPSTISQFKDVSGRVEVGGKGIRLIQVKARMPQGTRATVNGTIRDFSAPSANLEVDAAFCNVGEAISLFHRSTPRDKSKKETAHPGKVTVKVMAGQGRLGGLTFGSARATVISEGGTLTVEPIHLDLSPGTYEGKVTYDLIGRASHRLTMAGRIQKANADAIYSGLLGEKGMLGGILSGTFNVAGNGWGTEFLRSSTGAVQASIEQGVLRKFKVLSKVFSILNVSQIIEGNMIPDMSEEGMPFRRAQGSITLDQGVLKTENTKILSEAMNMSFVGTIDLVQDAIDVIMAIKPLVTIDRVVKRIPVVGWLLTGKDQSLVMANFEITGTREDPQVEPVPVASLTGKVRGIFQRVFELPGEIVTNPGRVLTGPKAEETPSPAP